MPPVLNRLLRGSFFLALKTPMAVALAFISIPLTQRYIGVPMNSAYQWAWGFGFFQSLLEFGMSSALQRNVTDSWTRGDRDAVNRSIACGMSFYACMSLLQIAALLGVAYYILPTMNKFSGEPYDLILKLLWLQIITAPFFGLSAVLSSVLQAARRYEFVPRLELVVVFLRFCILAGGLAAKINFFWVVLAQTAIQILLLVGPALWVMIRELGYRPHFRGANWSDTKALLHISGYMFLLQLSVVLADKIDTVILGFALSKSEVEYAITVYQNVSKPFLQIRQTGWTLAYLVMPAVASLAAAHDDEGLERIKYDGTRYLVGILLPISLLAAIYAAPFLKLWVGERFEPFAPLAQLFLVATLPLVLSVLVQMAIGLGKIKVIAISAFVGSLFNLPISYWLTYRYGVSGVIWGTVLTTLFSNLLVPGIHVFKVLEIDLREFALRTLSPPLVGASALVICCLGFQGIYPANPRTHVGLSRYLPFLINLTVGCLAYLLGYVVTNSGRSDLSLLVRKLRRRTAA
jgi:O-antigen/teichoic acid export membrane protein